MTDAVVASVQPLPALSVRGLSKRFGGLQAVDNVSLDVACRQLTALIGPNGAGKTTLFNCVAGVLRPDEGEVFLLGSDLSRLDIEGRVAHGLARTFQVPREFDKMTVLENMMVAAAHQAGERFPGLYWRRSLIERQEREIREKAERWIEFLSLSHLAGAWAETLSGGQKKLLELGRVLMMEPSVLLLDEPTAGVAPRLVDQIVDRIRALIDQGLTILFVEHNMRMVMESSDHVVVMVDGRVLTAGSPAEVRSDARVLAAYLGEMET